jgi:hypothetical protein
MERAVLEALAQRAASIEALLSVGQGGNSSVFIKGLCRLTEDHTFTKDNHRNGAISREPAFRDMLLIDVSYSRSPSANESLTDSPKLSNVCPERTQTQALFSS